MTEIVTFHVRSIRYGFPMKSEEFSDIESAIGRAIYEFDYNESCEQEIWCKNERLMDTNDLIEYMVRNDELNERGENGY